MNRIALALAALGLVGLLAAGVSAAPPPAHLPGGAALVTVGHHHGHPGHHGHGYYGHHGWYRPPVVIAPRPPVVIAPPPAYYPVYPYPYVPGGIYVGSPRFSVGVRF